MNQEFSGYRYNVHICLCFQWQKIMITKFKGVLSSPEGNDLNKMQYVLFNSSNTTSLNITKELEEIYNSNNRQFGLVINYKGKDIINEIGGLFRANKLWYINDVCIDYRLLDLTGEVLEILIDVDLEEVS